MLANALASLRHAAALDGRPDFRSPCRRPPRRRLRTTRRSARCCSRTSRCSSPTTRSQLRQVVNSMQTLAADMPSKNWLRDDLRAMAVENSRASGRDVDKIDCFMSVLQGIGPQAACCRRRRPVARTIARTIARTCCRKHAHARARVRARPNAHCPRPHTRPHKGDRGSRSGGRRRRGRRADAERRREQSRAEQGGPPITAASGCACAP